MPTDVLMPQMGESITEGTLTKWLKQPGDTVARDEPLFEISTDKVDAEIPSPVAGTLDDIKVAEGMTVGVNTIVCTVSENGSSGSAGSAANAQEDFIEDTVTPSAEAVAAKEELVSNEAIGVEEPALDIPVLMPQMGESITEGTLTKWLKKVGETVQQDEPIFEISTDKVDAEIPSPAAGRLAELRVTEGSTVTVNTVVAIISQNTVARKSSRTGPLAETEGASGLKAETPRSSPLVRKIASDNNIDISEIAATGASGRVTKEDITGYLKAGSVPKATTQPMVQLENQEAASSMQSTSAATRFSYAQTQSAPATTQPTKAAAVSTPQPGQLVPMSKMRSVIATRMLESKRTSAHVHTIFKVDMTRIARLREKEKTKYEQRNGVKLTYMPFITRAAVQALRKHPIVNAATEGEAIRYNRHINIGIAVALDWGLIVPVIKQTEEKSFLGIARSIVDVADRARSKKLAPDEVAGGTFTLTNSGIFGEQFGTPIIAQPQSAILGIGGLNKEPMVITDKDGSDSIAIRSIQRFTLGFDHRIIDGSDAGKFMSDFKSYLENWVEDIG